MAYPTLLWFAGYSNVSSVIIVVICFIIMAIFISLVSLNADMSRQNTVSGVEQRSMVKVVNPFFLQLEKQANTLKDGLVMHLSRLCPCKAVVLWGVKIDRFHDVILKTGHEIRRGLLLEDISDPFDLDPLHKERFEFSISGDDNVSIPCPSAVSESTLGNMPRKRYPVVVFVFVPESRERVCPSEDGDSECSNNIVGSISVIHLKDEIVTLSSHVIQQYIKTAGVPIYSLQPLFVNSSSESSNPDRNSTSDDMVCNTTCDGNESNYTIENHRQTESNLNDWREDRSTHSVHKECSTDVSVEASVSEQLETVYHTTTAIRRRNQPKHVNGVEEEQLSFSANPQDNERTQAGPGDCENEPGRQRLSLAECVVCQTRKAVCVLLPCRHACVCFGCFKLLDRCPMCRGAIESYFVLTGDASEEELELNDEENDFIHDMEQHAVNASFVEMWERFNMRLNGVLGFR